MSGLKLSWGCRGKRGSCGALEESSPGNLNGVLRGIARVGEFVAFALVDGTEFQSAFGRRGLEAGDIVDVENQLDAGLPWPVSFAGLVEQERKSPAADAISIRS